MLNFCFCLLLKGTIFFYHFLLLNNIFSLSADFKIFVFLKFLKFGFVCLLPLADIVGSLNFLFVCLQKFVLSQSEPNSMFEVVPGGVLYPKNDRIGFFFPRSLIFLLLLSLTSPSTQTELEVVIL